MSSWNLSNFTIRLKVRDCTSFRIGMNQGGIQLSYFIELVVVQMTEPWWDCESNTVLLGESLRNSRKKGCIGAEA